MKALVVGAGVGGLATALFLRRIGWDVEVVEATSGGDREAGAFLNLATNGLAVLGELGLAERVAGDAHPAAQSVLWGARGRRLGAVPNGPAKDPDRGSVIVRRAWLHEVLAEAVRAAAVPVSLGFRVSAVDTTSVRSADGRVAAGDIVIGADGVGSPVRRFVAPDAAPPTYTGLVGLGGFARGTGLAPTPGRQHFVFGRRSFFGYLVRSDGTVYWFANVTRPEANRDALRAVPAAAWLDQLAVLHRDDPDPVPAILAAATDHVGAYPIYDLVEVPRWHRDRAVLLGDAVHAMSPSVGQGASLALEDAETLVRCLRDLTAPEAAFAAYEAERRERTAAIAAYARAVDARKRAPGSAIGAAIRDAMMPLFLRRAADDTRLNWVYDRPSTWAEPARPVPVDR